ncbi:MAG: aldehyde dehydrogenase family protein [Chloroflexi bacterium]|nr:MAG: aldehyde dehydrogenase family protein [Chloroflexota bacterium]
MSSRAGDDHGPCCAGAQAAFLEWREVPAYERAEILDRAADLVERSRFDLAATMVFESAKSWHEADGDVCEAIDYLRYYAAEGERLSEPRPMGDVPGEHNENFHEGRGVTAVIAPWNFPLAIITGMTVGALAGGNTAILKPAAQSPIIAYRLVEILRDAGVPNDAIQYLPGPGGEIGRALVEHNGVDNIAFTGSSAVGLNIIEAAAKTRPGQRNVKRVIAEMGGKNAIIIDDDADLDQAISGVLVSAFGYAGQKCSACSRLIIVGSAYDEALERLKNAVASLVVGSPDDPAAFVPPVISADARKKIMGYIDSGRSYSTVLVQTDISHLNSSESEEASYYVAPTVFTDVPLNSPLAQEEIFGPVLSVFHAADFEEALEIALNSTFALTGGVFSRNPRHIELARATFRTGNLYINRKITGAIVGRQPFGGLAMSGLGEKAGGPDYVRQFMQARVVSENTMRRGFAPEEGA